VVQVNRLAIDRGRPRSRSHSPPSGRSDIFITPSPRASRRHRARILAILCELAEPSDVASLEYLLEDTVEGVRWNIMCLLIDKGSEAQKQRALPVGLEFLDSSDSFMQSECEELLLAHFDLGWTLIEQEIHYRQTRDESEESFEPREPTLAILLRIFRKGTEARKLRGVRASLTCPSFGTRGGNSLHHSSWL
jgi:hypothetical protein